MNNQEYYIGQIFEGVYPPEAAIWCNMNNAYIDALEDGRYEIKEIPPYVPTKEEQEHARASAYASEIDPLHARKMRKSILGEWTEEDEVEYIAKVKALSEEIVERYPYPTDPIYAEQEETPAPVEEVEEIPVEEPESEELADAIEAAEDEGEGEDLTLPTVEDAE